MLRLAWASVGGSLGGSGCCCRATMRFRDDFVGSCGRALRPCVAGLPARSTAAVLAPRRFLRAGWNGTRGPDAAGHAGRVVAHAGRAAAFRCGSVPASVGSALEGHYHQRPARLPVPRLAVRARRGCGRDPATGGGGVAAPVGVPAGAVRLSRRAAWPGSPWSRSRRLPIPTIPEFEDSRFERIEIGVIRYHASAAAIIDNNTDSTHVAFVHSGSFGADQDPRVPVGNGDNAPLSVSRSATGRRRSPALPPRNDRAPGTR